MEKRGKTITALTLVVALCFFIAFLGQAADERIPNESKKNNESSKASESLPIWKILQDQSAISVEWVDHTPNPRFAIYDVNGDNAGGDTYYSDDLVLDKETGLVWARDANILGELKTWFEAVRYCRQFCYLGNRQGWRLPTIEELSSLIDYKQFNPALPSGHPFIKVDSIYWSYTTTEADSSRAWCTDVRYAGYPNMGEGLKSTVHWLWPVRGGNAYATGTW